MLVLQKLQVGNLVASQTIYNFILSEKIGDFLGSLLILVQLRQNVLSLFDIFSRWL